MVAELLENILQAELDQPGSHGGLGDDTERCRAESRAGIGELRVIERVVELHAEGQDGVFPKATHSGLLA